MRNCSSQTYLPLKNPPLLFSVMQCDRVSDCSFSFSSIKYTLAIFGAQWGFLWRGNVALMGVLQFNPPFFLSTLPSPASSHLFTHPGGSYGIFQVTKGLQSQCIRVTDQTTTTFRSEWHIISLTLPPPVSLTIRLQAILYIIYGSITFLVGNWWYCML